MKSAVNIETASDEKAAEVKAAPAPVQALTQKVAKPAAAPSNGHKPSNAAAIEALDVLAEQGSEQPAASAEAPAKATPAPAPALTPTPAPAP